MPSCIMTIRITTLRTMKFSIATLRTMPFSIASDTQDNDIYCYDTHNSKT
jgi:hypothetical protein